MLNINPGYNTELLNHCKTLSDYMRYVDKVRTYARELPLQEAVEKAIEECIKDDILAEFLRHYRAEAKKVSIYEYDEEKHMQQIFAEGKVEGAIEILQEMNVSEEVILTKLMEKFALSREQAEKYLYQSNK